MRSSSSSISSRTGSFILIHLLSFHIVAFACDRADGSRLPPPTSRRPLVLAPRDGCLDDFHQEVLRGRRAGTMGTNLDIALKGLPDAAKGAYDHSRERLARSPCVKHWSGNGRWSCTRARWSRRCRGSVRRPELPSSRASPAGIG